MVYVDIPLGFTVRVYQNLTKTLIIDYNEFYSFNPGIFVGNIGKASLVAIFSKQMFPLFCLKKAFPPRFVRFDELDTFLKLDRVLT